MCPIFSLSRFLSNVLTSAIEMGVKKIICLSTDKAAYPINAMGMSKALMEKVAIAKSTMIEPEKTTICCTRYGNVMASRGSVIPLFVEQIKAKKPITITNPEMTRFLMSLDEAIELVLFAFDKGNQGDLFIQKAPATTMGILAQAIKELFNADNEIKIIGIRHGEKIYETLLTKEEKAKSEDLGNYFRVPKDERNLNYEKYFDDGDKTVNIMEEYNSHNTKQLNIEEVKEKLMSIDYIKNELQN
jgi:UDP-glucose 4-epimerase